jgi:hypothetical protein
LFSSKSGPTGISQYPTLWLSVVTIRYGSRQETNVPIAHVGSIPLASREPTVFDPTWRAAFAGKSKYAEYAEYVGLRYAQYAEYISGELLLLLASSAPNIEKGLAVIGGN